MRRGGTGHAVRDGVGAGARVSGRSMDEAEIQREEAGSSEREHEEHDGLTEVTGASES